MDFLSCRRRIKPAEQARSSTKAMVQWRKLHCENYVVRSGAEKRDRPGLAVMTWALVAEPT
jgi:hypothetical protein